MKKKQAEGVRYTKSAAELRLHLDELVGVFAGTIEQAADRLITESADHEIKRHALLWKINGIPFAFRALFQPDPAVAVLDTWAYSMQMTDYFERGAGKDHFGRWRHIGRDASRKVEARIMHMIACGLPDGDIMSLKEKIQTWALGHPIEHDFLSRDAAAPVLAGIIGDRAMDTLETIGSLAFGVEEHADQMAAYINLLTKQARWQAELVAADTADSPVFREGMETLIQLAGSVNRLTPVFERFPGLIAGERQAFFETLRQERIDMLVNIEQQRLDTLAFLTRERTAVIDEFQSERRTITAMIRSEREEILHSIDEQRMATLTDFEAASSRILERALKRSEQLIDQLIIRSLQFLAVVLVCVVVAAIFLIRLKGNRNEVGGDV